MKLFVRLFVFCVVKERAFNTDLHPGNFLFSKDKVCFLDFGNVKYWGENEGYGWGQICNAVIANDMMKLKAAFLELGIAKENSGFNYDNALKLLRSNLLRVLATKEECEITLDLVKKDLMEWTVENPDMPKFHMPTPHLYGYRLYWGFFSILARLKAKSRWQKIYLDAIA